MTDQLTPTDRAGRPSQRAGVRPAEPRLDRAKSEIMAGGAVTENWRRRGRRRLARAILAMAAILALFVWLAFVNIWIFVFVVGVVISIFLHELGHFIDRQVDGHEGHPVLPVLRAAAVELPTWRDRVRRAGAAARRVRAHHRHEPDGRGRSRPTRDAPIAKQTFPEAAARDLAPARSCTS